MPSYYLQNTFFNTYHRFEGGDGKRLRDSLAEKFSFMVALGSDDLSNAAKREARTWSDGDMSRSDAALAIRERFGMTLDTIEYAANTGFAGAPAFHEQYAETFSKARAATPLQ